MKPRLNDRSTASQGRHKRRYRPKAATMTLEVIGPGGGAEIVEVHKAGVRRFVAEKKLHGYQVRPYRKRTIRFGGVTILRDPLPPEVVARQATLSLQALERVAPVLMTSGVTLPVRVGVPLFQSDPDDPTRLVRTLNGRQERGRFIGSDFVAEG